ncbi:hypothetical protein, partial [Nostoc sp. MG11]|uniref:hypothetical protein n=1 Tax=Nostoc sp. MG11 TaxID=2721166 RepID=UPI001D018D35
IPSPKQEYEERGRSVVELLSSQTTTQKLQFAHVRHFITLTMPATADKRYNNAAVEPNNFGYVSNERPGHYVRNITLGRDWW